MITKNANIAFHALACVTLVLCSNAPSRASVTDTFSTQRSVFSEARAALDAGNTKTYKRLRAELTDYPIAHYLDYAELNQRIKSAKPSKQLAADITQFEQNFADRSLTGKLTRQLQSAAASQENWPLFLTLSESEFASDIPCATLRARASTGQLTTLDDAALELWKQAKKHPEACADLLVKLEQAKTPSVKAIWERIFEAVEAGQPEFAEPVLGYLSTRDRKQVQSWIDARDKPEQYLKSGALKKDGLFNRRAFVDLVLKWSKEDTIAATAYWLDNYKQYRFYNDRYYDTHRLLAMRAAYRRLPEAYDSLYSLTARDDDLELKEWRIRAALFNQDWKEVLRSIKKLPEEEQQEDHWAYWEARALEESGHQEHANKIYDTLSQLQSYHGFLSADKLDRPYALENKPIKVDTSILSQFEQDARLIRAHEYYQVDIAWEGRREWNSVMNGAEPEELAALAVLAERWQLFDRAIFSAGRAEQKQALTTRFPLVYQDEVDAAAQAHAIPEAWVFGVMRRESGYIRDVRSSAGAIGLMQLMPKTAKYVARLQGDSNWRGDLTDAKTNIGFGTFYLRHVMDKFDDHQVLATASYNAGPHRVKFWLPNETMPADVWIDAIPYSETRRYVRAVMAYTTIYEWHLTKEPIRLREKLTPIPAAMGT
jgi:soluble lytic murein transglycosylase